MEFLGFHLAEVAEKEIKINITKHSADKKELV